jgi:hypothetical protein
MLIHSFELSGLGKAPFSYISATPNQIENAGGIFWCQHCGTTIKNRHFIRSSNNIISVVGIDCLRKTGDEGLSDGARRFKASKIASERDIKRIETLKNKEKLERIENNGKTLNEIAKAKEMLQIKLKNKFTKELEKLIDEDTFFTAIMFAGFGYDMVNHALTLQPYSPNQLSACIKCVNKHLSNNARVNSTAYKENTELSVKLANNIQKRLNRYKHKIEDTY